MEKAQVRAQHVVYSCSLLQPLPVTSPTTFRLSSEDLLENAKGVTARKVKFIVPHLSSWFGRPNTPPSLISLAVDEVRLEDIPAFDSL